MRFTDKWSRVRTPRRRAYTRLHYAAVAEKSTRELEPFKHYSFYTLQYKKDKKHSHLNRAVYTRTSSGTMARRKI